MQSIANCPEGDAEKSLQTVLKKFDLTLNVAVRDVSLSPECMVPVLMPEDYIQVLCEKGFMHRLLGGSLASCACPSIRHQLPTIIKILRHWGHEAPMILCNRICFILPLRARTKRKTQSHYALHPMVFESWSIQLVIGYVLYIKGMGSGYGFGWSLNSVGFVFMISTHR